MKKEKYWFKNKKIWKWIISNLFLIFFGTSAIINITYLPKYYILKNRSDNALKINISAYDNNNKQLFFFQYQSIMATLGDLMEQYKDVYILKSNGGLGRSLSAITYYDYDKKEKDTIWGDPSSNSKYYWMIYYKSDNIWEQTPIGIDMLSLHMNDEFQLRYENKKEVNLWQH